VILEQELDELVKHTWTWRQADLADAPRAGAARRRSHGARDCRWSSASWAMCGKGGDQALRRYAAKLDGLTPQQPFAISARRWNRHGRRRQRRYRPRLQTAARNIPAISPDGKMPKEWSAAAGGLTTGQRVRALGCGGVLCAQRALPVALVYPCS